MTEFRSRWEEIEKKGLGLYAISVDTVFCHQAFADSLGGLPFQLLADFERSVVRDWGVRRDDVAGYRGMPTRSVFIVDQAQRVRWAWVRSQEQPLPDYDQVMGEAEKASGPA